jgi:hypothetical protein
MPGIRREKRRPWSTCTRNDAEKDNLSGRTWRLRGPREGILKSMGRQGFVEGKAERSLSVYAAVEYVVAAEGGATVVSSDSGREVVWLIRIRAVWL